MVMFYNKISITYYNKSKKTEDLNSETKTLDEYFETFINSDLTIYIIYINRILMV